MTLSELGIHGGVYHIRMDHQHPAHYSTLPPPNFHLSPQSLKRYNEVRPPPYPEVVTLSTGGRSASAESGEDVGVATTTTTTALLGFPEKTASDVGSMSVDPGSVDDQLSSSQGSWGEAASSSEIPEKKEEVNEKKEVVDGDSEVEKIASLPIPENSTEMNKPEKAVSIFLCMLFEMLYLMCVCVNMLGGE